MMICDADFDELFPNLKSPERQDVPAHRAGAPSEASIARREDDRGKAPRFASRHDSARARREDQGYGLPDPAWAGIAIAMMPTMAAYGATSAMIAAYGKMAETSAPQDRIMP